MIIGTGATDILWPNLAASAVVAALTALAVEYIAKPRLEARKERILERDRRQRGALNDLDRALFFVGRLVALQNLQYDEVFRERSVRFAREIEQHLETAVEALHVRDEVDTYLTEAAGAVAAGVVSIQIRSAPDASWDVVEKASERLETISHYLRLPWWRPFRRYRLLARMRSW